MSFKNLYRVYTEPIERDAKIGESGRSRQLDPGSVLAPRFSMPKDFYKTLGVDENADAGAIKKAYRKLARELHPDRNPNDVSAEERFKKVQEAYETLSDPAKRTQYDRRRRFGAAGGGSPFESGFRYRQNPDGTYVHVDPDVGAGSGMSDLFERFFGGSAGPGAARSGPARRKDATAYDRTRTVRISFERMLNGGRITVSLDGEKMAIPFPKGVRDGHKVRVRGKGKPMPGGGRGDLYVTVRVDDDDRFKREGLAVHTHLEVSVFDALLGAATQVLSPHGQRLKVTIPEGSQPGDRLRIKAHGVETDKEKGDLIVHLDVFLPKKLTEEQKTLISRARDATQT